MTDKELFSQKADEGYMVCFVEGCPLRESCLRWKVGRCVSATQMRCNCVNPHFDQVGTKSCPMHRRGEKVKMAKGMTHIFTDDMPKGLEPIVRTLLIEHWRRTYYFEYRNGKRLLSPAMQEHVRRLFRQNGWQGEVCFDEYVEAYEW